ncbi:MAG: hypothetical protein H7Z38_24280, partial [Rubrivivax sp.]|nr:hypothetical protein [Pyrinomonadaceae bacterium]
MRRIFYASTLALMLIALAATAGAQTPPAARTMPVPLPASDAVLTVD